MFDGKRSRRDCLLPIAVALILATVGAFGWATTSATAEPAAGSLTSATTALLKVTRVETSVEGTAYKYMEVKWSDSVRQPVEPVYMFASNVAGWVREHYPSYIGADNAPTVQFTNLNAERTRDFADRLLAAIQNGTVSLPATASDFSNFIPITDDDAAIVFNLSMGGYVIRLGNGSRRVYQPIATFVKPKWNDAASNYELEVNHVDGAANNEAKAKSKVIESKKTVAGKQKTHGQIGEDLLYRIETPIPRYPTHATNQKFGVQDCPALGLDIQRSTVQVYVDGESAPLPAGAYSVTEVPADASHAAGIKVEFSNRQYRDRLAEAGKAGRSLTVEYKARLNVKAPIKNGTNNSAWPLLPRSNYSPESGDYASQPLQTALTTVYTYGIRATKVAKGGRKLPLPGAKFQLYKKPSGKNGSATEVKVTQATEGAGTAASGKYIVHPEGAHTITSGNGGMVQIDGLGAGTYELREVSAPDGYALRSKPITITIHDDRRNDKSDGKHNEPDGKPDATSTVDGRVVTLDSKDNRLTFMIENGRADFMLPETGAMGAAVFAVIGMVLVAISSVLVIIRRRARRFS